MKFLVPALLLAGLFFPAWFYFSGRPAKGTVTRPDSSPPPPKALPAVAIFLSYPRSDLRGLESVRVEVPDERSDFPRWVKTVLSALYRPPSRDVVPVFPSDPGPAALFLDERGSLYLDLSPAAGENAVAGVEWETLAVKALVESVASTMPGVKAVKILVGGNDRETLWGHVDLRRPFPIRPLSGE